MSWDSLKKRLADFDPDWDYTEDTDIDVDNLDVESAKQGTLFMDYAALEARAIKEYMEVWEEVKTLRSELIKEFREDNPKAKNDEVEAFYRTDEDYKEAKQRMIEAEYIKNLLSGAVQALHKKKAGIERLTELHGQAYFSDLRKKEELEKDEDARGKVRRGMSGSRRRSGRKK